jgi:prolyl-tRNA synthetase
MKDAYSFHTSCEDLAEYYEKCHRAYENIFRRCGIGDQVVSVKADSGMMGGKIAHEFMLLSEVGEDSLAICGACDYRSNMEAAECVVENEAAGDAPLEKIPTPGIKAIEDLARFCGVEEKRTCKAVLYQKNATDEYVVVFLRGDLEVNEVKLCNLLGGEAHPAVNAEEAFPCGFIGPVGLELPKGAAVVYDRSLRGAGNLVAGANREGYHYKGFTPARDVPGIAFGDVAKILEGGVCPQCKKHAIGLRRGVEVGHIFQLGTRYTEAMGMTYLDRDGKAQVPVMGCYGIGTGRLLASVCEARRDEYGPVWPISVAPWQVHICAIRSENPEVAEAADGLYGALQTAGIEVLYDDRKVSAGFMFSDADLLGVPVRAILSPKTLARGAVELRTRDKAIQRDVALAGAVEEIGDLVKELMGACRGIR